MSQVQSSDFWLVKVQPIRGVSLVEVHYAGTDSNGVERVASNACVLIKAFYSTNQPTFHITDIEAGRYSSKPWWQRIIEGLTFDELTALFQR
jgi:hypothetical protein